MEFQAETAVREVLEQVRASPVVQGDETGWRQDGSNGYVWTFSTPSERYFLRRGRDKGVVDEVLDSSFSGVLVSDFYAAYTHYPGLKQRCWAHLLRDIHDLKGLYPEDAGLAQWAEAVHQVYTEAKASVLPRAQPGHRTQLMLEEKLMVLARPFLKDPLAVQAKLCRRMERFIKELFVSDPAVPSDNNATERSLLVTSRISGGTRSGQGTDSKMTLASLFGTWRARGLNPLLNAAGCSLPLNSEQFPLHVCIDSAAVRSKSVLYLGRARFGPGGPPQNAIQNRLGAVNNVPRGKVKIGGGPLAPYQFGRVFQETFTIQSNSMFLA